MSNRSIIYIDGFNFYNGVIKNTKFKWLDIECLFRTLRQDDEIQSIHYFTALIFGNRRKNQQTYLDALSTFPLMNIIFGKFKIKSTKCRVQQCTYSGSRIFDLTEEKKTDVNIALQLVDDAYNNRTDRQIIVSGDSDLVPAIQMVKKYAPKMKITVYVPSTNKRRGAAREIRNTADKDKTFPVELLQHALLPDQVPDGKEGYITKPSTW